MTEKKELAGISSLSEGMRFECLPALVVEKKVATAKNGKEYADLTVRDKTGSIKCKIWNYYEKDYLAVGRVVTISGEIKSYQGTAQATLTEVLASSQSPEEYAKGSRFNIECMWTDVKAIVAKFEEPLTKFVAEKILERYTDLLKKAPAATGIHNAWNGGLLEHVWAMCRMAPAIIENYKVLYGTPLSADKVYFGLITHDVGKIWEYDINNPAYPKTGMGLLVNHLVMGPALVFQMANTWMVSNTENKEKYCRERDHLMHIMAAHHGQLDWGSPVVPSTIEAIIVHQLDLLDSRVMHAMELIEGKDGPIPGFSEKSWSTGTSFMKYN